MRGELLVHGDCESISSDLGKCDNNIFLNAQIQGGWNLLNAVNEAVGEMTSFLFKIFVRNKA